MSGGNDEALVEELARAICASDGLDYDEVCGREADPDLGEGDSGSCPAAYWEEHDASDARGMYRRQARAILPVIARREEAARNKALDKVLRCCDESGAVVTIRGSIRALKENGHGD